ncbi:hypothetical protein [Ureaplasma diversum]|uniref:Lipoprotein n=1 Tax=Ureaplasma diversum NCTC 246 TaxID=1188241 RepID=A0A084F1I5_9BACT|nr:hypothetical protein [Ureaplasma diversum]KEZ24077.1 Hypothetical protein, predicted lipoprotein [Ureaplasma diversum NCTC 246]
MKLKTSKKQVRIIAFSSALVLAGLVSTTAFACNNNKTSKPKQVDQPTVEQPQTQTQAQAQANTDQYPAWKQDSIDKINQLQFTSNEEKAKLIEQIKKSDHLAFVLDISKSINQFDNYKRDIISKFILLDYLSESYLNKAKEQIIAQTKDQKDNVDAIFDQLKQFNRYKQSKNFSISVDFVKLTSEESISFQNRIKESENEADVDAIYKEAEDLNNSRTKASV